MDREDPTVNLDPVAVFTGKVNGTNLLHVAQDVLTAVEDTLAFLRIQVENEVSGVVGIRVFIPVSRESDVCTEGFD